MATKTVNPTRMELLRLKTRLKTARRGHKLLKDKRDELMKQFLVIARESAALRERVEAALGKARDSFTAASALMSPSAMQLALCLPGVSAKIDVTEKNVTGVIVPTFALSFSGGDVYPYGFAATSGELDDAVGSLSSVLPELLRLAELEKTVMLMAGDIERTRRRVNALEHVMIPEMEETIRSITMKLDENERGNLSRLMKVKDMMLQQAHNYE